MGTDHVGMRRNREGQLVTLASGFPEPSPLSLPTPCYLASPISFRCFCQTQASVSRPARPFRRWSFPSAQGERAKSLGITPFSPARPLPSPSFSEMPPAPLAATAPTAALYQFRTRGSLATLGPPRGVPISVGKPNQG